MEYFRTKKFNKNIHLKCIYNSKYLLDKTILNVHFQYGLLDQNKYYL